jgi:hypothetical protein
VIPVANLSLENNFSLCWQTYCVPMYHSLLLLIPSLLRYDISAWT